MLIAVFVASPLALAQSEPATIAQTELVQRAQQLYDALAPGDPAPWKRYLAEDAIFVDELGKHLDIYFRPGAEGRKIFHRDAAGHVDMMIDRRNNEDLLRKKIGPTP